MSDQTSSTADGQARQGFTVDASDPRTLRRALDLAFEYRGDVTVTRASSGEAIEGYVFDRVTAATMADSKIRMIPANGDPRITIPYDDITKVRFTGRDTAAGKSFESWMKKYVQKKLAGQAANIEPEPLDE